ncbi:MAG TPA: N-terminal phage integrase SAM-like domain-containing protein [Streptosporangiaceae bacterium]|nr:N-terminal phage integrase SAM-like domain-containing protein [Streptosporangiaceae bacterium]
MAVREHPAVAVWPLSGQLSRTGWPALLRPGDFRAKSDAERFLALIEVRIYHGEWTDPELGKVELRDYAERWIAQRPGLRPRTSDLYFWLLRKHIAPSLGGVPLGKLSTAMIRQWRSELLSSGVAVSVAAR